MLEKIKWRSSINFIVHTWLPVDLSTCRPRYFVLTSYFKNSPQIFNILTRKCVGNSKVVPNNENPLVIYERAKVSFYPIFYTYPILYTYIRFLCLISKSFHSFRTMIFLQLQLWGRPCPSSRRHF